ncbi:MAG: M24 family metallopeptidase, partial [Planctomycetes bacterium]|nr:M24 family metallopeptidase [Planctomycetota bacterium]
DFMYLSGFEIPDSILVVDGVNKESVLFFTATVKVARNEGINAEYVTDTQGKTGIEKVYKLERFGDYLEELSGRVDVFYTMFQPEELMRECSREKLRKLQSNMVRDEWDGRLTREQQFVEHLKKRFSDVEVKDCSEMIWDLRVIKSPAEIEVMRRAGQITVQAHKALMKATRPGMKEYELAALFEYICKKEGANELAYYTIICSAENHQYLHYYGYDRTLEDGDFLVIDGGCDFGYYDTDITISYPANGKFTERQKEIYAASHAVHEACMQVYRPGLTREQVGKEVEDILRKQGFDLENELFQKMTGGFGHYVGMAVHDVGGSPRVLKPGMVFANEPLATFPEENLGVRVEDTILITADGCENLTAGLPRTVEEIEALMGKSKK